jgi:hypothetical protein
MTFATAKKIAAKGVQLGYSVSIDYRPPEDAAAATVDTADWTVRLSAPNGEQIGVELLAEVTANGIGIATSDALFR